ncbi:uncharacterized protein [Musca autumnalis]|uniref:uncharacterized protein n=1 Tax=Musca autumnalis TaxID=221902 RepID=UPI003CF74836
MKFVLFLAALFVITYITWADTKVLHNITYIKDYPSTRVERISLNNANTADEELVINGQYNQTFFTSDHQMRMLIVNYVADKNGYRVNYTLKPELPQPAHLPALCLKTLCGGG